MDLVNSSKAYNLISGIYETTWIAAIQSHESFWGINRFGEGTFMCLMSSEKSQFSKLFIALSAWPKLAMIKHIIEAQTTKSNDT